MSGTALWIMCAAIVAALAAWLVMVALAQRHPETRKPKIEPRRGRVQGATHTGGGRSVAPRRDETVIPGENPEESSVPGRPGPPGRGSGNPMDL
jgi:hypothetical protein